MRGLVRNNWMRQIVSKTCWLVRNFHVNCYLKENWVLAVGVTGWRTDMVMQLTYHLQPIGNANIILFHIFHQNIDSYMGFSLVPVISNFQRGRCQWWICSHYLKTQQKRVMNHQILEVILPHTQSRDQK